MLTAQAIGNLGADPEMRYTPEGVQVTSFRLGCRVGKDKESGEEITAWINVSCWRSLAELANQYLSKGSKVWVSGFPRARGYISERNDGRVMASFDITADKLEFLSPRGQKDEEPVSAGVGVEASPPNPEDILPDEGGSPDEQEGSEVSVGVG